MGRANVVESYSFCLPPDSPEILASDVAGINPPQAQYCEYESTYDLFMAGLVT